MHAGGSKREKEEKYITHDNVCNDYCLLGQQQDSNDKRRHSSVREE